MSLKTPRGTYVVELCLKIAEFGHCGGGCINYSGIENC